MRASLSICAMGRWRAAGIACVVAGAVMAQAGMALAAEEIRGEAKVVSGNEIQVGKRTVRLFGMAAPGLEETCTVGDAKFRCGVVAWAELIKLADGHQISCDVELKEGETVFATCYLSEADLNEALVRSGWARAVPQQSDRYVVDEADAQESQRGLWADYTPTGAKKVSKKKK